MFFFFPAINLWQIHFDIWQNQYNIVKFKNKIKFFKKLKKEKKRKKKKQQAFLKLFCLPLEICQMTHFKFT